MERLRQQDKETINRQNQQLADYESELNMLRRRVNGLEQDLDHESSENKKLQEELFKTVQVRLSNTVIGWYYQPCDVIRLVHNSRRLWLDDNSNK